MYFFLGTTDIPITTYTGAFSNGATFTLPANSWTDTSVPPPFAELTASDTAAAQSTLPGSSGTISLKVTFPIYVMAMEAFVGWFFFVVFGGVGLASLPIDLICAFIYRPRHMDASEFAEAQLSVRTRVNDLIEVGELLRTERAAHNEQKGGFFRKKKDTGANRQTVNKFKQAVYILENDVAELKVCTIIVHDDTWRSAYTSFAAGRHKLTPPSPTYLFCFVCPASSSSPIKLCHEHYHKYNPLIPIMKLILGIISGVLSILWIVQIIVFVIPSEPFIPFLNDYFQWFDSWFPLFGVISVGIFSMYLLVCVMAGCFKFGVRFFCLTLHPMKYNGTYMNSFLFNLGLVLLCAMPVVQFSTIAFADYARFTNVNQIFGVQVKYLRFFRYFWTTNAFIYAILGMFGLSAIYLLVKPRDVPFNSLQLKEKLRDSRRR